jgi:hypothetical protein
MLHTNKVKSGFLTKPLRLFILYIRQYFFWSIKVRARVLIIANSGVKLIEKYAKQIDYDYILADRSETEINKLVMNYLILKKPKKISASVKLEKHPTTLFLPHNIYNLKFYDVKKRGGFVICALKVERFFGKPIVLPNLFFVHIKLSRLDNSLSSPINMRIDMFANFLFLMLIFFLVKLHLKIALECSRQHYGLIYVGKIKNRSMIKRSMRSTNRYNTYKSVLKHAVVSKQNKHVRLMKSLSNVLYMPRTAILGSSNKRTDKGKFVRPNHLNLNYTNQQRYNRHKKFNPVTKEFVLMNSLSSGKLRTTRKRYNFLKFFKFNRPKMFIKGPILEGIMLKFKKVIKLRQNLIEWVRHVLQLKLKKQFYKNFLLVKSPYFAIKNSNAGLYKIELQLNFLLLRSFLSPTLKVANLLILHKYITVNDSTNYKPLSKISLLSIVHLSKLAQLGVFLFKPYRQAVFYLADRAIKYLRYKYYFRKEIIKRYHYFNYFNKRHGTFYRLISRPRMRRKVLKNLQRQRIRRFRSYLNLYRFRSRLRRRLYRLRLYFSPKRYDAIIKNLKFKFRSTTSRSTRRSTFDYKRKW